MTSVIASPNGSRSTAARLDAFALLGIMVFELNPPEEIHQGSRGQSSEFQTRQYTVRPGLLFCVLSNLCQSWIN